jgi:flagellar basal body-associated protein FliL
MVRRSNFGEMNKKMMIAIIAVSVVFVAGGVGTYMWYKKKSAAPASKYGNMEI